MERSDDEVPLLEALRDYNEIAVLCLVDPLMRKLCCSDCLSFRFSRIALTFLIDVARVVITGCTEVERKQP